MIKGSRMTPEQRARMSKARKDGIASGRITKFGAGKKNPIYELDHEIKVISENHKTGYVMCYIEAHPLFPNSKISNSGRQYIQRSRVIMTAYLGRVLLTSEHVHHKDENDKHNDDLTNLEILSPDLHNKHHKTGTVHSEETKKQIAVSLKDAHRSGLHAKAKIIERNSLGQIVRTV